MAFGKKKYAPQPFEQDSADFQSAPEEVVVPVQPRSEYAFKVRNLTKDYD